MAVKLNYPTYPLYVGSFIEAASKRLGLDRYDAVIDFHYVSVVDGDKNILGRCYGELNHCDIYMASRSKRIISRESYLKTIAHEMIHAEQFFSGRLSYDRSMSRPIWLGKNYQSVRNDSPWEKEAYFMENVIYDEIINKGYK